MRITEGVDGFGYVYILGGNLITPTKAVLDCLATMVVEVDPLQTALGWDTMWWSTAFIGPRGAPCVGISAIDMALWDIKSKITGQPAYKLLGGYAEKAPAYYSGLFLNATLGELVHEAQEKVAEGWWALKRNSTSLLRAINPQ